MIKNKRTEMIVLAVILLIQTVLYVCFGANKSYIHMDEAYSLGLASYDKVEIQDSEDFYDTWHDGAYYRDYLEVNEDEKGDFSPVYENQKNDVHPPFFYLLLRVFMGFSVDNFTMWGGLTLNIIIHLFTTVFTYLVAKKLLQGDTYCKEKSAFISLISALTLATLTSMLYIRMYSLAALIVLITVYLHIKLFEEDGKAFKWMVAISATALIGSLTHYFYLYFIFALFVLYAVVFLTRKHIKNLCLYIAAFVVAAVLSLSIFPHSLDHMFFGYRGQGVISNLLDSSKHENIFVFLKIMNTTIFNYLFWAITAVIVVAHILRHRKRITTSVCGEQYSIYVIIAFPTVFSFIITAISAPWLEIRYLLPIIAPLFLLVWCYLYRVLGTLNREKISNVIVIVLSVIMLLIPTFIGVKPDTMFAQRHDAVEDIKANKDVPMLYFFDSNHNRFLDDIMLFSIAEESYVAKDVGADAAKLAEIFADIDTEDGVIVFINGNQDDNMLLETLKNTLGLEKFEYMHGLNACRFYKIS